MAKSLWAKFFALLVVVSVVGLSATVLLRALMLRDFAHYIELERQDRMELLTARLEALFLNHSGWPPGPLKDAAAWAYMMGIELKLEDQEGRPLVDTSSALEGLMELERTRVETVAAHWVLEEGKPFERHILSIGGAQIAHMEVRFLSPRKDERFLERSDRFFAISVLLMGTGALALSIVFSRRLTRPIEALTKAAQALSQGQLERRVPVHGHDELARLSSTFNSMSEALAKQEALRRHLTANVAHELRTPLAAMRGEVEGMMDGLIAPDRETLQSLLAELKRLRAILDGMEELAHAEASAIGGMELKAIELGQFIEGLAQRFRPMFAQKGVGLVVNVEVPSTIEADPEKLSQVLINLISNALKATPEGGTVSISASTDSGGACIEVADTGVGISPEDLPNIFERFYRASPGGLGIGLTIARELVRAHGGSIEVASEPTRGAKFSVRLPVKG